MKKMIYILLVAVGMTAPATEMKAQCGEIQSVNSPQDPCEGTLGVELSINRTGQPGTITWSRVSGEPLPAIFTTLANGDGMFYGQITTDMTDTYICTFTGVNGCTEIGGVDVVVNPNPNGWFTLSTNCAGVTLYPGGGTNYLALNESGSYTVPFDSIFFPNGHDKSIHKVVNGGGFRVFNQYGCYSDVAHGQIWVYPLVIDLTASKRRISPGQSTTLTATTIWDVQNSKTKWFKNNVQFTQGVSCVTVSDTGTYKVQMRATVAAGNCVNTKQIKITPKPVIGARVGDENEIVVGKESILDLQIGPNPASDQIQISGYDERVEILDMNGKVVSQLNFNTFEGTSPQNIDVSSLPNGMYLVRSGEQTQKLIVRR
ncbi:MAG: T9SS type A sorting domain-containing protein [Candidatus Pacebacteria bacterium]|nr:T9SS type A sorting domain-containing protein [Candidatus Paceibacterota bacterium]MBP9780807.1 T9SS type A sorting domain-containing protein [Candidatus Paceibacterota bacterium]